MALELELHLNVVGEVTTSDDWSGNNVRGRCSHRRPYDRRRYHCRYPEYAYAAFQCFSFAGCEVRFQEEGLCHAGQVVLPCEVMGRIRRCRLSLLRPALLRPWS